MNAAAELSVTLSAALLDHLKGEARRLSVSLEWLVASLVVDTIDGADVGPLDPSPN